MFASDIAVVVQTFKYELLHLDTNIMSKCSRVDVSLTNFYCAQAIASLFELCKPSKRYSFVSDHDKKDKNGGYISIVTTTTDAGNAVDPKFLDLLKNRVLTVGSTLSKSWLLFPDKMIDNFTDLTESEKILYKENGTGLYLTLFYLNLEGKTGIQVNVSGDSSNNNIIIAGSTASINKFLNYIDSVFSDLKIVLK